MRNHTHSDKSTPYVLHVLFLSSLQKKGLRIHLLVSMWISTDMRWDSHIDENLLDHFLHLSHGLL